MVSSKWIAAATGEPCAFGCALRARGGKLAGKQHVPNDGQVGDEIELLENESHVLDPKPVSALE
jgi:hypothetical protein